MNNLSSTFQSTQQKLKEARCSESGAGGGKEADESCPEGKSLSSERTEWPTKSKMPLSQDQFSRREGLEVPEAYPEKRDVSLSEGTLNPSLQSDDQGRGNRFASSPQCSPAEALSLPDSTSPSVSEETAQASDACAGEKALTLAQKGEEDLSKPGPKQLVKMEAEAGSVIQKEPSVIDKLKPEIQDHQPVESSGRGDFGTGSVLDGPSLSASPAVVEASPLPKASSSLGKNTSLSVECKYGVLVSHACFR